jgi:polysaccharide pyruvyl transferase WcaK-like protein
MNRVLVCEFVPIANKGEEAILRGYEDLIGRYGPVEITYFDRIQEPRHGSTLVALPLHWLARIQPSPGRRRIQLAKLYFGYLADFHALFRASAVGRRPLQDAFQNADCVLVGHDGYFDIDSSGILLYAKRAGKRAGIFGCGCAWPGSKFGISKPVVRRALMRSDFCMVRERFTQELMLTALADKKKVICAPDPAFAMRPCLAAEAQAILAKVDSVFRAQQRGQPIIGVTAVECGVVFENVVFRGTRQEKMAAHAAFMAGVLDAIIRQENALIVFLPHSIEPGKSDVPVAHRIAASMKEKKCLVLEMDFPARILKGIIGQLDFLVGERTHSLINSVGAHTPFVGLTNKYDLRTHGILGGTCGCEELLFDIDEYPVERAISHAVGAIARKHELRQMLVERDKLIQEELQRLSDRFFSVLPKHNGVALG